MSEQKVLIIDDDPGLRKTLSDILKAKGYETVTALGGAEGIAALEKGFMNIVIIDLALPDMPGINVLEKAKESSPSTEAIILTGNATLDSAIEATNRGAFSYLLKPYDIDQLLLHMSRAIAKQQAGEKIIRQNAELQRMNTELKALYEETRSFSLHDPLTGLGNRRLLQIYMDKGIGSVKRYGACFSVLMVDIDHFKKYNDTHGHSEGDRLLAKLSNILVGEMRCADWVFRYGGEEFLIMLFETGRAGAAGAAERLRKAVEERAGVTVSIGVAEYDGANESKETLIDRADAALYKAKENGRNRVEISVG